jgi:hypothetical protein
MRKPLAVGAVAITAITAALVIATTAFAEHVTPTTQPGNVACPAGLTELKVEPVADGTFTDGTLTVTIDVRSTAGGQVFDWTSNIGVDVVIVKGGNASNIYTYDPPAESTGDTGLHAPVNRSGSFAGLSHISFCYDVEPPTTTTTTTTTTDPKTTTTTDPKTTTTTDPKQTTTVPK